MAVTAPASLTKIRAEFGGPANLKAYYRGGPYVPDTAANAAISTDPNSLRISQFVGAVKSSPLSVSLSTYFLSKQVGTGQTASGTVSGTASGGTGNYTYQWELLFGSNMFSGTTNKGYQVFSNSSGDKTGDYRLRVSDGVSTAYSNDLTVQLTVGMIT